LVRRLIVSTLAVLVCAVAPSAAGASQLIDRNAKGVRLQVDGKGYALLTYRAAGRTRHVLAWGATNALAPTEARPQVKLRLDYAGGWGVFRRNYWQTFRDTCRPYDGPKLVWLVTACKARDGSYWAVQAWQVPLPDLGFTPWLPEQRARELHLSHWTGPLAKIEVWSDWVYGGRWQQLFGRLSYAGTPVHGFHTTNVGAPTDKYGRLLYLDTYNSRYGAGWRRENSFVAHNPTGVFCYGFFPFDPTKGGYVHPPGETAMRGPGTGSQYRMTVEGPGVTPDVMWQGPGLHDYDPGNPADVAYERQQNAVLDSIVGVDKLCRTH
jgi:hypothetical protein